MNMKICPICGVEKNARGFNFHMNACKGTPKKIEKSDPNRSNAPKELPGIAVFTGLLGSLQDEITKAEESLKKFTEAPQNVECPYCHCCNTYTKLEYMEPLITYRCTMCGQAYQLHLGTGEYIYER